MLFLELTLLAIWVIPVICFLIFLVTGSAEKQQTKLSLLAVNEEGGMVINRDGSWLSIDLCNDEIKQEGASTSELRVTMCLN